MIGLPQNRKIRRKKLYTLIKGNKAPKNPMTPVLPSFQQEKHILQNDMGSKYYGEISKELILANTSNIQSKGTKQDGYAQNKQGNGGKVIKLNCKNQNTKQCK